MSIPYGYKKVDGNLVVDDYQSKVIKLVHELRFLELSEDNISVQIDEEDITRALNKFKVPSQFKSDFNIDEVKPQIIKYCSEVLQEKLLSAKEKL